MKLKEFIQSQGWEYYRTGCSCNGSPVTYRHPNYFNHELIHRGDIYVAIKKGYQVIRIGNTVKQLIEKLKEYEIYTEDNTEAQDLEAQQEKSE